jgi:hypothetical protein
LGKRINTEFAGYFEKEPDSEETSFLRAVSPGNKKIIKTEAEK